MHSPSPTPMSQFGARAFLNSVASSTRASSTRVIVAFAMLASGSEIALAQRPAGAQGTPITIMSLAAAADSARARQDSLSARLRRAEEALASPSVRTQSRPSSAAPKRQSRCFSSSWARHRRAA